MQDSHLKIPDGYKQTDVGIIPEGWEVKRLGDIAEIASGGTPDRQNPAYWNGEIPWITTSQIDFNVIDNAEEFISKLGLLNSATRRFPKNSLLMAMYGQGKTRGKVALLGIEATINQACAAIQIHRNILTKYVFLNLSQRYKEIRSLSNTGNQENLNGNIIKSIQIPLPPLSEQQAIAEVLSDVDALVTSLDRLIAKKRNIKQGAMQLLLTGKKRLAGFSGEWETQPFNLVFRKRATKNNQIQTIEYADLGIYPVIDQGKNKVVAYSDNHARVFKCPRNGVIVFGDHTREIKFVDFDFLIGADGTQILSTAKGCSEKFYFYQLLSREIPNTGYNRHYKFLQEMIFPTPSFEEQTAIARILSDMETEIEALEKKREKYKAIKQGMMQELLTGKTRLI
jgi:type I restriction enzyme S subunit